VYELSRGYFSDIRMGDFAAFRQKNISVVNGCPGGAENARLENTELQNAAQNCRSGKGRLEKARPNCRTVKRETGKRENGLVMESRTSLNNRHSSRR